MGNYRICTFNVQKFNTIKKSNRPSIISNIIKQNRIDILVVQEVIRKESIEEIGKQLDIQRKNWDYYFEFSGKSGFGGEGYGLIWNKRKVSLVDEKKDIKIGSKSYKIEKKNPQVITNMGSFSRPPLLARFYPVETKIDFEIRLLTTHIKFSNNSREEENSNDEEIETNTLNTQVLEARREEFDNLVKIYKQINIPTYYNQYSKQVYTIILGDYNLCLTESPKLNSITNINRDKIEMNIGSNHNISLVTTNQYKTTLKTIPKDIKSYLDNNIPVPLDIEIKDITKWSHNYDHFTYDVNQMGNVTYNGALHPLAPMLTSEPNWEQVYEYREKLSDHIPLLYEFDFSNKKVVLKDIYYNKR